MIESIRYGYKNNRIFIIFTVIFAGALAFADTSEMFFNIIGVLWLDILICSRRIRLDIGDAFVVLTTLSYRLITNPDPTSVILGTLKRLALYQVARYLADPPEAEAADDANSDRMTNRAAFAVMAVAFALFLRGILNYSYYLTDNAFYSKAEWPLWDMGWSTFYFDRLNEVLIGSDEHPFYLIIMGSMLPYFVMRVKNSRIFGITGILLSAAALWAGTLITGGLGFVCAAFAIVITLIVIAADKGLFASLRSWTVIVGAVDILVAAALAIKLNLAGLGDWFTANIWSKADGSFYRIRFTLMGQALKLLPQYPFGGYDKRLVIPNVKTEYYAYNSWIDIAVHAGFIPFIISLGMLVSTVAALVYIMRRSRATEKYIILAAFVGITAYHMLEPAYHWDYLYWSCEIALIGFCMGGYAALSGKYGLEISFDRIMERLTGKEHDGKAEEH